MKDYRLRPLSSPRDFVIGVLMTGTSAGLFSLWTGYPFWGCWGISLAVMLVGEWITQALRGPDAR